MNRPRRHHFVPRFYLEGFCADDARALAVYDRVRNAYRAQRPTEVAHRRDYYAYEDEHGNPVFTIEEGLGEVEGEASAVIQRVDNDALLSDDDRLTLATYAAFQFTRTPAYAAWVAAFRQEFARNARQEQVDALPEAPDLAADRGAALGAMLRHAPKLAHVFMHFNWTIWRRESDRQSFVTTDSPVCILQSERPEPNIYAGAGMLMPVVITVLPLSQASVLAMSGIGNRMDNRTLTRDWVRRVNLAVVSQAQHFIFGRDLALVQSLVRAAGIDRRQWRVPLQVN
ncbi:DUF4238 domain-containing protein [Cupriavidus necator]|uniref:DUF4238 domain-containing protein n=1 Tax=Cupriavidus necator TaxID=106590 RepID=A0A1U9UKU2_CUPNE|nr:DUF4238 domain-containing protein [Cupriavidus necator]